MNIESPLPLASKVVHLKASESAIPFGGSAHDRNAIILGMTGNTKDFSRKFTFRNSSEKTVIIDRIYFSKSESSFQFESVESGESLPITASAGHTFTIRIGFHGTSQNTANDFLRFSIEGESEPLDFPVEGINSIDAVRLHGNGEVAQAK
ncbi:MAG: hypothetical protein ABI778_07945 [Ignavibacteriota bacterium]